MCLCIPFPCWAIKIVVRFLLAGVADNISQWTWMVCHRRRKICSPHITLPPACRPGRRHFESTLAQSFKLRAMAYGISVFERINFNCILIAATSVNQLGIQAPVWYFGNDFKIKHIVITPQSLLFIRSTRFPWAAGIRHEMLQ